MRKLTMVRSFVVTGSLLWCATLAIASQDAGAASPPTASTGEAVQITYSSAVLKGSLYLANLPASYYFQYGPTSAYGYQTPLAAAGGGTHTLQVTAAVGGLSPGGAYHFRLVAVNPSATVFGQDRTFTARKIPLTLVVSASPSVDLFGTPFSVAGVVSGTGAAGHMVVLQGNPFPYLSAFKTISAPVLTDASGAFSFVAPGLPRSTELRVSTLDTPPAVSRVIVEPVAVRVSLHVRATGRRGFARLYGTIAPGQLGALVRLQWLPPHGKPMTVGGTVIVGSKGAMSRFSRVVRIRRAGLYRALAVVSGAQVSGHSRSIRIG